MPIFSADGLPLLADSCDGAMKLHAAQRPMLQEKRGDQGMMLPCAVPWPPQGTCSKRAVNTAAAPFSALTVHA